MLNLSGVDRHAGETTYLQVARAIRQQIAAGQLALGERLPSAREVRDEHGVGRHAYGEALRVLRLEGLIVMRAGLGAFVSAVPLLEMVDLLPGDELDFRAPDDAERRRLEIGLLSAVAVVTRAAGGVEVYGQAVTRFRVPGE